MAQAHITKVSSWNDEDKPVPWATKVVTGHYSNTGEPIFHWEVEVNSLEDLARISAANDNVRLILNFGADGSVFNISIYDDYVE